MRSGDRPGSAAPPRMRYQRRSFSRMRWLTNLSDQRSLSQDSFPLVQLSCHSVDRGRRVAPRDIACDRIYGPNEPTVGFQKVHDLRG